MLQNYHCNPNGKEQKIPTAHGHIQKAQQNVTRLCANIVSNCALASAIFHENHMQITNPMKQIC